LQGGAVETVLAGQVGHGGRVLLEEVLVVVAVVEVVVLGARRRARGLGV